MRSLTHTERACVGLLNALIKGARKDGRAPFAFLSDEQLAHWLDIKPSSLENILSGLRRDEFIKEYSFDGDLRKLTVKAKWLDPITKIVKVAESENPEGKSF